MKALFTVLFNWKKHPASVFFFVLPLAFIAFSFHFTYACIMAYRGNYGYLVIYFAGIALLIFALWPLRRQIFKSITGNKE